MFEVLAIGAFVTSFIACIAAGAALGACVAMLERVKRLENTID